MKIIIFKLYFHSEGALLDYYTKEDALEAVGYAEEIIQFCRDKIV